MSATNYPKLVYARIWTLLLGHAPFATTYKEGNRIRFDTTARDPRKESYSEADLPQVTLFPPSMSLPMFTFTPNYGHKLAHDPTTANDWAEGSTFVYRLELIHRTLGFSDASLQTMEFATALRKGNPKLGLSYVRRWGPVVSAAPVNAPPEKYGEDVWVHNFNIPVELFINGSDLVT